MVKKIAVVIAIIFSLSISLYLYYDYLNRIGSEKISWAKYYVDHRQEIGRKAGYSSDGFEIVNDYMVSAILGHLKNEHVENLIDHHCMDHNAKCAQINIVLAGMFLGKKYKDVSRSIRESESAIRFAESFYYANPEYDKFPLYVVKDLLLLFKARNLKSLDLGCDGCVESLSSVVPPGNEIVYRPSNSKNIEYLWVSIITEMYSEGGDFSVPIYAYTYLVNEKYSDF